MANLKRNYDSSRRLEQAQRNYDALIEAGRRRFLADGYAATTIASVAADVGVSVEMVYKSFGSKSGLVAAIWERGLAGRGQVPAPERSDRMQATVSDPLEIIRNWGQLTTEVAPQVAPILLLIRSAAATDLDMRRLLAQTDSQRLRRMRRNARVLDGRLKPGVTQALAAEIMWTYSSPDLYDLLVVRRGWSLRRYGQFVTESMVAALLPQPSLRPDEVDR
ncbi:TetR/AcrR family transcriptional regulator [Angustibacter sp. McL0619]|uniref:TetR/AcrR family transcriptional regulator n=1 Tax=Angustibacter sp. McL0619 TaxID=3415676 RepID=UPI003CEED13E